MSVTFPNDWTVRGALPEVDVDQLDEEGRDSLDEDLMQAIDPTGSYVLDVGWYPSGDLTGKFRCVLVSHGDWEAPTEVFESRNVGEVANWLTQSIAAIREAAGEPGRLLDELVALVLLPAPAALPREPETLRLGPRPTADTNVVSSAVVWSRMREREHAA